MDEMSIFTVLATGWLLTSAGAQREVGLKSMSGYRGVTFGNALVDKELRVLAVSK